MGRENYAQLLKDPRWQKRRLEIFERDGFTCRMCGDSESTLHVHHLRYRRDEMPWETHPRSLLTTCESCHEYLHQTGGGAAIFEALISGGANLNIINYLEGTLDVAFTIERFAGRRLTEEEWKSVIKQFGDLIEGHQQTNV